MSHGKGLNVLKTECQWATRLLAGIPVDQKKILAAIASHAQKNRTNAYMLEPSVEERDAKVRGDWKVALEEFKKMQAEFHEKSNDAKNASLYVDFEGGKFVAPSERISDAMLDETRTRNETFLAEIYRNVKMLLQWNQAPEDAQELIVAFVELAESTKAEKPDAAMAAVQKLIEDFVKSARARLDAKPVQAVSSSTKE